MSKRDKADMPMTIFDEFTHNVFCRRQPNQHRAKELWKQVELQLPVVFALEFRLDWFHYVNSSLDHTGMELAVKELRQNYGKRTYTKAA